MKTILLFGAGKSSFFLIKYIQQLSPLYRWSLKVVDTNFSPVMADLCKSANSEAISANVENDAQRALFIQQADIVISLLPPTLHYLIARDCIHYEKNLLTASYRDASLHKLENDIISKGLIFIAEMGLDPGIDHMSAMQLIHDIQNQGGEIISFKSHCGGLIAPESDNNPWHYKVSWNPRNIVTAGINGATYLENGVRKHIPYEALFSGGGLVDISEVGKLAWYANRDSMDYIELYGLNGIADFMRTTLRYSSFCQYWNILVQAGLTDPYKEINTVSLSFSEWGRPAIKLVNEEDRQAFVFLGLTSAEKVPSTARTSADILQYLLESRLAMEANDKDMVVMQHEIGYKMEKSFHSLKSTLVLKGTDRLHTAMAKTVGLPLGIATRLILEKKIVTPGLHLPIIPEIYEPVMAELAREGIVFKEQVIHPV